MKKALDMIARAMRSTPEERLAEYETRKVACVDPDETENGVGVSTAWVTDGECFETALTTESQVIPIERYTTREAAIEGHARVVEFAKTANGKRVISLGLPEVPGTGTTEIVLGRKS